jgi:nondiscriminating glutamyl-tRNA synthetase
MSNNPRVRFAPSPTGELHVGNARTALFNWLFARHHRGSMILRIEDTDESRSDISYQINLINDLQWLGLDWDEGPQSDGSYGPYRQSERLDIYKSYLKQLMDANMVYPCYCTEKELEEERQNLILSKRMPRYMGKCRHLSPDKRKLMEKEGRVPSYRFKIHSQSIEFKDLIRGEMKFEADAIGDFIIVRSNGMPAYNFAVVIDDHLMNISHVIRGEDHLSNTAVQIMLYRAFGFEPPVFAHHSLILGKDRTKLSKRHGSVTIGEFRRQGILPEAMINYLALLGSSFTDTREVLNIQEMIRGFKLERASKSGAIFDEEKLRWMNAIYIRSYKTEKLIERLEPFLQQSCLKEEVMHSERFKRIIDLIKMDLTTLADIQNHINIFFDDQYTLTAEAKEILTKDAARRVVKIFAESLVNQTEQQDLYRLAIKHTQEQTGLQGKELFMPIRAALTGKKDGPELDKIFTVLGRDSSLKRLQSFINGCDSMH